MGSKHDNMVCKKGKSILKQNIRSIGEDMIEKFLLNYQNELIEEKKDLLKSLKNNELSLKENEEFVRYIEISEDENYDLFSPQSLKNNYNENGIKELKEEKIKLEENNRKLREKVIEINNKQNELEQIIASIKVKENEESEVIDNIDNTISNIEKKLIGINNKVRLCNQLIDIDKNRCKLELQNLSKTISGILERIEER